jgi:serine/threonine protein kinase
MGEPVDGRTDLYALGVLLYELTTGRLPFTTDHPLAIISQHVNAPVVPPRARRSDLPAGLDAAIVKLLAKSPSQRYATARDARDALARPLDAPPGADQESAAKAVLGGRSRWRRLARSKMVGRAGRAWPRRAELGAARGRTRARRPRERRARGGKRRGSRARS